MTEAIATPTTTIASADAPAPTCAIGPGASFDGLLTFWGLARVEGKLRGDVVADGTLEVGPEADVHARVEVDVLVVEGLVEGEVVARERVEVRSSGRITAAVRTPSLVLAEGGRLEGRLEMARPKSSATPAPEAATAA
jgi:cytoskeletal protein CcmA (bactofilin family)